jgi:hypothetical protein
MDVPEFVQQNDPQPSAPETHHGLLATHPYVATVIGVTALVLFGALFVINHSAVTSQEQTISWGGTGTLPTNPQYQGDAHANTAPTNPAPQQSSGTALPIPLTQGGGTDQNATEIAASSLDQLLAAISTTSVNAKVAVKPGSDPLIASAYALIPRGLVATTSAQTATRTAAQQDLYTYGNNVGAIIQTFEDTHRNAPQVLKDQSTDRTNPDKAAAVAAIGNALSKVGADILATPDVPPSVALYSSALGKSYQNIGARLVLVAQAQSDTDFLAAVKTYDSAADTFTGAYVGLASYLSASGVTFSPEDAGSVFSFTPASL